MSYASIEDLVSTPPNQVRSGRQYLPYPPQMYPPPSYQPQVYPPPSYQPQSYQPPIYPPPSYQPSPVRIPVAQDGAFVPMTGSNPIRGMITSRYPDVCSQYGSSSVHLPPNDYYGGSQWCQVGILMSNQHQPNSIYGLEARFIGNSWEYRAKDALVGLFIYLNFVGNGPYGAFRTNDTVMIPGKDGRWTIQIQTNQQPYLLYVPV